MGACEIMHSFKHHDWRQGVRKLQGEADDYYGHQEGYSGAINSCEISFARGNYGIKTKKQLDKFIHERMQHLGSGDGECIAVKQIGFIIGKPSIKEYKWPVNFDYSRLKSNKSPAAIFNERGRVVRWGTLVECKEYVKMLLIQEKFEEVYYIINAKKKYKCIGEIKNVKTTTKKSNDKQLVLPMYEFVVYGWARS